MQKKKTFIAIDLKSFFASVECVERQLDPLTTNLVVADASRTDKTICLAVSPSLKSFGIGGRARLFEVVQRVKEVNEQRRLMAPNHILTEPTYNYNELKDDISREVSYITATPRMSYYMAYSARVYNVYLRYVAPEDIHVYSIDEVFIDATNYLFTYKLSPHDFAMKLIKEVLKETGITATAGIGTNLYLCKVAMDIVAKHIEADENGVRIAELDEFSYRRLLWGHRPLTDFWRIGHGYAKKLAEKGMYTMGDVARCSVSKKGYYNEELLYKMFGINAELLIDHAWGWEPCQMSDIKKYRPAVNSLSSGQVLHEPYESEKAKLVVREMMDLLVLDLVSKQLVTDSIGLYVGYDIENLKDEKIAKNFNGEVVYDHYGRAVPKPANGSVKFEKFTSSTKAIIKATMELFDKIVDKSLLIRRLNVTANHVVYEDTIEKNQVCEQLDFFTDYETLNKKREEEKQALMKEKNVQHAILDIKAKFGKNSILKGMNLEDGATAIARNGQIGGHKA